MTTARVYRLDIIYPEGSREPGWRPALWDNPEYLETLTAAQRRELRRTEFRWPRERMFLSSSGAYARKWLLTAYGADAEVEASDPVTWPNYDDESDRWERGETAANWYPELEEPEGMAGVSDVYILFDETAQMLSVKSFEEAP